MSVTTSETKLGQTPSQTVGPFFAYCLTAEQYGYHLSQIAGSDLLKDTEDVAGERITIEGRILDGNGEPVSDALVEIWQADAHGRYVHPADTRGTNTDFKGFGRMGTGTDSQSRFVFETVKPGSIDGQQAPHIGVIIFARGLLSHLFTRIYFSDEAEANAADPVLAAVPEERRRTLIGRRRDEGGKAIYDFEVRLQGDDETVFFDV